MEVQNMSKTYVLSKNNYKEVLDRMVNKSSKHRMFVAFMDGYTSRSSNRKHPKKYKKGNTSHTSGKMNRFRSDHFVYISEQLDNKNGFIVIDIDVGNVITLFEGDIVIIESYGFITRKQSNLITQGSVIYGLKFTMHTGDSKSQISDYQKEIEQRQREWKELFEQAK